MDPYMSIPIMLLISFPEAVLLSYLAVWFMGYKPRLPELILIGLIQAVIAYIPYPSVHTLLSRC